VIAGARVLVTGGAGLVGSAIVDAALDAGAASVVVLDDLSRGRKEHLERAIATARAELVEGDIRDRALVRELVDGANVVFHEAAIRITRCAEEPRAALEVLVEGTFNVVEAAAELGVARLVAASSASVYGLAESFPTPESQHPYANRTLYGAAKVFNEGTLRAFADTAGLDYVALRYFNVYGPRMDAAGAYTEVLVRWMERIDEGLAPLIFGDGSETADYVFVDDVARANLLAAECDATDVVCNVATGIETRLDALASALCAAMGAPDLAPELAPPRAVNPVGRRWGDASLARRLLGFEARVDLADGLGRLVDWWRSAR
jgi:UDP-glucose 4-epimerase